MSVIMMQQVRSTVEEWNFCPMRVVAECSNENKPESTNDEIRGRGLGVYFDEPFLWEKEILLTILI